MARPLHGVDAQEVSVLVFASIVVAPPARPDLSELFSAQPRAVSGRTARSCDLAEELGWDPAVEDPSPVIDALLACDRSGPVSSSDVTDARRLGEWALELAAAEPDPVHASRRALAAFELGQAVRYGTTSDQLQGLTLQLHALGVLEDRSVAIVDPSRRVEIAAALGERMSAEPRFTVALDAALAPWAVRRLGWLGAWVASDARETFTALERVLASGSEADALEAARAVQREQAEAWWPNPLTSSAATFLVCAGQDELAVRARAEDLVRGLIPRS